MFDKKIPKFTQTTNHHFIVKIFIIEKLCNMHLNREYYEPTHELTDHKIHITRWNKECK